MIVVVQINIHAIKYKDEPHQKVVFCWCSFFSSFLSYFFFVFRPCCAHLVHQYRSLLNCASSIQVLCFAFSVCNLFGARTSLISPPPFLIYIVFFKSPSSQSRSLFKLWQMLNKHAFGSFDAWQGPEFCADLTTGATKKTCLIFELWIINPAVFSWRLTISLNYRSVFRSNALSF